MAVEVEASPLPVAAVTEPAADAIESSAVVTGGLALAAAIVAAVDWRVDARLERRLPVLRAVAALDLRRGPLGMAARW